MHNCKHYVCDSVLATILPAVMIFRLLSINVTSVPSLFSEEFTTFQANCQQKLLTSKSCLMNEIVLLNTNFDCHFAFLALTIIDHYLLIEGLFVAISAAIYRQL